MNFERTCISNYTSNIKKTKNKYEVKYSNLMMTINLSNNIIIISCEKYYRESFKVFLYTSVQPIKRKKLSILRGMQNHTCTGLMDQACLVEQIMR